MCVCVLCSPALLLLASKQGIAVVVNSTVTSSAADILVAFQTECVFSFWGYRFFPSVSRRPPVEVRCQSVLCLRCAANLVTSRKPMEFLHGAIILRFIKSKVFGGCANRQSPLSTPSCGVPETAGRKSSLSTLTKFANIEVRVNL